MTRNPRSPITRYFGLRAYLHRRTRFRSNPSDRFLPAILGWSHPNNGPGRGRNARRKPERHCGRESRPPSDSWFSRSARRWKIVGDSFLPVAIVFPCGCSNPLYPCKMSIGAVSTYVRLSYIHSSINASSLLVISDETLVEHQSVYVFLPSPFLLEAPRIEIPTA